MKNAEEFSMHRKRGSAFQIGGTVCERARRKHMACLEIVKVFPLLIYQREGEKGAFDSEMNRSIRIL